MTATIDPFAAYRPALLDALRSVIEAVTASYGVLLREQIAGIEPDEASLAPALLCIATTEAMGGRAIDAMPAATALGLIAMMGRVFQDIAAENESGLGAAWGLPRALNAGDAFFVLAQQTLTAGTDPARVVAALSELDKASRAYSDELHAGLTTTPKRARGRSLLAGAVTLGAIASGADAATVDQMRAFGRDLAKGQATEIRGVPDPAAADRLWQAARYAARSVA
jgi:hypothetical protein